VKQEVKVIWQKAPNGGPIPRLGVTAGGRKLYCHQAPGRAVVTGREESESERVCETTPFVFSNKPVYSAHSNLCFNTIRSVQCSHLRSTTMSLISSPRCVRSSRWRPARQLSPTEMSGTKTQLDNTKEKQIRTENTTHYNASTYIRVSYRVRQPKRSNHLVK